jgi:hypothetical protein
MNSTFRLIAGTAAFGAVVMSQPAIYARSVTGQIPSDRGHDSGVVIAIAHHSPLPIASIPRQDNEPPVTPGSGGTRVRQTAAPFQPAL